MRIVLSFSDDQMNDTSCSMKFSLQPLPIYTAVVVIRHIKSPGQISIEMKRLGKIIRKGSQSEKTPSNEFSEFEPCLIQSMKFRMK